MPECHVDQSGRTDVLTVATALALADDLRCSVLIPAAVKRACAEALRARSVRKRLIGVRMFAAGLVLLLEQCAQPQPVVVIDLEYVGWDGEIKGHVLHRLAATGHWIRKDQVIFRSIGKGSPAHDLAWRTLKGQVPPTLRVAFPDLMRAV